MAKSTWAIDPTHSEIGFKVKHMMFTNVSGKFNAFEAEIINENDHFESSSIEFKAETNSIDTNNEDRDKHLKSGDFFDVENYAQLTFSGKSIQKLDGNQFKITGDLTIKGETKEVVLDTEYSGLMKDPWGNIKAGLSISGKINRKDFGLTWNAALETGGVLVGEEVKLVAEIQLIKQ